MNLLKTSMLSGVSTFIRIACGLIITKTIAVFSGPSGVAVIGQLQNVINISMLICGDFLKTAVTKYTAEYEDARRYKIWSAGVKIVFILCVVFFVVFYFFSNEISKILLGEVSYAFVFRALAFSLPFFVINSFILAILNGMKEIKMYIFLNISLSVVSLFLVVFLSYSYGLNGALLAYATNQSVVCFITIFFVRKQKWFSTKYFQYKPELAQYKSLFGFALLTFTSIAASNSSILFIRNYLIDSLSPNAAGNWQAIWALSQVVLSLITTSLSTYLLPTLSKINNKKEITRELYDAVKIIMPLTICMTMIMYLLRDYIILVLYTNEFDKLRDLFLFQMIGINIKVFGWLFGYVLVAKGMIKYTVSTEILFSLLWCFLTVVFVGELGLNGVLYSFLITVIMHAITMCALFRYKVR
ncbi:hypothetical protein BIY21_14065 [Vibrio ponticus]|uniref:O-antigen flippase n=1 Tax=Vibrio ponticus TaxID=265668 RepID=A0ABX3FHH6_9VIBR|nr:O-antigen translocase [Vibrio ponticus]OLQ89952.1 hypothetical protein BIY21_14065 [Vibrio ponticus]